MSPNPPPPADEETWRNRFIALNLVRIGGTVIALLGLYLWHSDQLRQGGAMEVGLPIAVLGVVISFLGPRQLAKKWQSPPEQ